MGATCFCGCGREVAGRKPGARNKVAGQVADNVATFEGALERDDLGDRRDEVARVSAEGRVVLDELTRVLHGPNQKAPIDKKRTISLVRTANKVYLALMKGPGKDWHPTAMDTYRIACVGTRAMGVVTSVDTKAWGGETTRRLDVTVAVEGPNGERIELSRVTSMGMHEAVRVGEHVEVGYTADHETFVFRRPVGPPPSPRAASDPASDDRVAKIRELGQLLEEGLLTREEFDREKARLLAD